MGKYPQYELQKGPNPGPVVVFNGKIDTASQDKGQSALNIQEYAFKIFNIGQRPVGYCERSPSVGDVIKLEGKYYLSR